MPRQGYVRIAHHFFGQSSNGSLLEEVLRGGTDCVRTVDTARDEVVIHMKHPLMDEVDEGEWPEYMVVVTALPGQSSTWEFRRLK